MLIKTGKDEDWSTWVAAETEIELGGNLVERFQGETRFFGFPPRFGEGGNRGQQNRTHKTKNHVNSSLMELKGDCEWITNEGPCPPGYNQTEGVGLPSSQTTNCPGAGCGGIRDGKCGKGQPRIGGHFDLKCIDRVAQGEL